MIASAAAGGGTKMSAQSAPAALTASSTVFQTGKPSWVVPPLPGVTPPTTWVPYSLHRAAWKAPSLPVIPCTTHARGLVDEDAHACAARRQRHGLRGAPSPMSLGHR